MSKNVRHEYIISLEDGRQYRTLRRHLNKRGLTPEQYRAKWGRRTDYPMVDPAYSEKRSQLAKAAGLGQKAGRRRRRGGEGGLARRRRAQCQDHVCAVEPRLGRDQAGPRHLVEEGRDLSPSLVCHLADELEGLQGHREAELLPVVTLRLKVGPLSGARGSARRERSPSVARTTSAGARTAIRDGSKLSSTVSTGPATPRRSRQRSRVVSSTST